MALPPLAVSSNPNQRHSVTNLDTTSYLFLSTKSGDVVWLEGPHFFTQDLPWEDLIYALSNMCRYNGHINTFYSVAEHCVHMANYAEHRLGNIELAKDCLRHDLHESLCGDVPYPVKMLLPSWSNIIESRLEDMVVHRLDFHPSQEVIKQRKILDRRITGDENEQLRNPSIWKTPEKLDILIHAWSPQIAYREYALKFERYFPGVVDWKHNYYGVTPQDNILMEHGGE